MSRVVCVVQARMGSSRLPGKSLMPIAGRPLIAHVLDRAGAIPGVDAIIAAVPFHDRDIPLVVEIDRLGFDVYMGSELDVLDRVWKAADYAKADVVIRVTGDCPLLAPDVAERVLDLYLRPPLLATDYASNDTASSGWPDGFDVEVFSMAALELAHRDADERPDREHVTSWIRRRFTCAVLRADEDRARVKLSVDREEDLERVRTVFAHLEGGRLDSATTFAAIARAGL